MKKENKADEWIVFAESDWAIAKQGKASKKILYETLCFHCQQATEKSIKGVCLFNKINFPKTHDIDFLLELLKHKNIEIPKLVQDSRFLTEYAVISRYPGNELEIGIKEYKEALKLSEYALKWAKSIINKPPNKLF